jgi:hypothetical protein
MAGGDLQTVVAIPRLDPRKVAEEENAVATPEPMVAPTVLTADATAVPTVPAAAPTVVPAAAATNGAPAAAAVAAAAICTIRQNVWMRSWTIVALTETIAIHAAELATE